MGLGAHGLSLTPASGVPQLVEPVLWDYGADLDIHGKGQYHVSRGNPLSWPPRPCSPNYPAEGNAGASVAWLRIL